MKRLSAAQKRYNKMIKDDTELLHINHLRPGRDMMGRNGESGQAERHFNQMMARTWYAMITGKEWEEPTQQR